MNMRVVAGMSGGVDSSVAALLLKRAGFALSGVFMHNWNESTSESGCHADADRRDALTVCGRLGIPFRSIDFVDAYRTRVFAHFLDQYRAGRTPNPDVLCNREIKFGTFLAAARDAGAEKIAMGHYARKAFKNGRWMLLRARDQAKDQTYFLHTLDQTQLGAALFPLGNVKKQEVRRMAGSANLPVATKKDSTGICFIGERNFRVFLSHYLPGRRGELRMPDDTVVGEHHGAWYYTPGQRSGLHIGGRADGSGEPWYVIGKDVTRNVVYVAQGHDNRWLQSRVLTARDAHWIAGAPPATTFICLAVTRYRQPPQPCRVTIQPDRCEVRFEATQRAIAPGQSVVFYQGEECLGGAVVDATDAPSFGNGA